MDVAFPLIATLAMLPGNFPFLLAALCCIKTSCPEVTWASGWLKKNPAPFISGCNWQQQWLKAGWILKLSSELFLLSGIYFQRSSLRTLLNTASWLEKELWEFPWHSYYYHHCLAVTTAWDLLKIPLSASPETTEKDGCNCKPETVIFFAIKLVLGNTGSVNISLTRLHTWFYPLVWTSSASTDPCVLVVANTQGCLSKMINSAKCQMDRKLSLALLMSSALLLWSILPLQPMGHLTCGVGQFNGNSRGEGWSSSVHPFQCHRRPPLPHSSWRVLVISRTLCFSSWHQQLSPFITFVADSFQSAALCSCLPKPIFSQLPEAA